MPNPLKAAVGKNTSSNKAVGHKCLKENIVKYLKIPGFFKKWVFLFLLGNILSGRAKAERLPDILVDQKEDLIFLKIH